MMLHIAFGEPPERYQTLLGSLAGSCPAPMAGTRGEEAASKRLLLQR
jgi:hypothetical protein